MKTTAFIGREERALERELKAIEEATFAREIALAVIGATEGIFGTRRETELFFEATRF